MEEEEDERRNGPHLIVSCNLNTRELSSAIA